MEDSTAPQQKFTCFKNLPPELRLQIWEECLPSRSVPMHDSTHRDVEADLEHTAPPAGPLPPLIGRVCRESRDVALKHGSVQKTAFWDTPVWFNRKTDHIYIGADEEERWMPSRNEESANEGMELLVHDRNIPLSIDRGIVFVSDQGYPNGYEFARWTLERAAERMECNVVLSHVTMHATHEQAVASGLFGHFAEETPAYIDIEDDSKIQTLVAACSMLWDQELPARYSELGLGLPRFSTPPLPRPQTNAELLWLKDNLVKAGPRFDLHTSSFQVCAWTLWLKMHGELPPDFRPGYFADGMEEQEPYRAVLSRLPKFNFVVAVHLKKTQARGA
ncbi:uncharacterized protein F4812DRAFT_460899 [Daldinia caldariorum]|uniref:uncharacterized protein n=1 Tax=Daldinia caldariorum TaxID=326644 RepID=UPI00200867DA|nr:uncharacterized protein F4812DRAFT_460899 [Daldinia caldariorum]KAI1465920.1 hypothetical protein F4812DRAFT_460899 [Daldinia caldariorum]